MNHEHSHKLKIKNLGIDTYRENIIFMRADCHICESEGFTALTRVVVHANGNKIIATLNVVYSDLIKDGEAGLSIEAMKRLNLKEGSNISISHLHPIQSFSKVRSKMYGNAFEEEDIDAIIKDIVAGHYSNVELAGFITACAGTKLSLREIISLTKSMISAGQRIKWDKAMILDKHCVGGLPGNRTTPIVVSIVAAAGIIIPKTSSRAITSPAGTADTMETMAPVNLSISEIKKVVEKEGGCIAWGGAVKLSPADDILISVEKSLDVDSEGQMIASVLSKKIAAGATHTIIDIPVGPTAKVRTQEEAERLRSYMKTVGNEIGLKVDALITDGSQPVGNGIGPALEAMDVLSVLRNEVNAPNDLKNRSIMLAGALLELSGKTAKGNGIEEASKILAGGFAYKKFMAICEAQGGFTEPQLAPYRFDVLADSVGIVSSVDNRNLARVAKLAGAPKAPSAGILYHSPLGKRVTTGDLLFSIYAESKGELEYATEYLQSINPLISLE